VYGWGFSVEVPQTGEIEHRSRVGRGIVGFGNAYLLTGDRRFVDAWSRMIDLVSANARTVEGRLQYPHMHGDDGWYAFRSSPWHEGAMECWFFTCEDKERARVADDAWLQYLEGENPDYPEQALAGEFAAIRRKVAGMRRDTTTPDTRLADDPMEYNPATVEVLRQLMLAGLDPGRGGGPLHCRLRYFDPVHRRAGIPKDVAALVDRLTADQVAVTLVNVSQSQPREVLVQAGAYAEHEVTRVDIGGREIDVAAPAFRVRLAPGAGGRLVIHNERYANAPTLTFPWESR
jgi:hypothetical protein